MFTRFLKYIAQKEMMSSSPQAGQAEMNSASVEDLDFIGSDSAGKNAGERCSAILAAMTDDEKLSYITGYKSLGIRALPRHGLPSVWMSDATSGPRSYGPTTAFPSAIAMAASWDRELITESGDHIAETARAKGVSILLGPGINIARIPTCGRNFEYMGEDPFLAGEMAGAYIRSCNSRGVLCTVKHLAVNNSDYDRHKVSSDLDERTLRELYLPAFETAVKEGATPGVMSAYNPVNGTWASENHKLITEILREEWGFHGFVISDWNSLYSTSGPLKSGLDLEMPGPKWLTKKRVEKAITEGSATWDDVDRMAGNLMRTLFSAGVYDRPVIDSSAREFCPEHDEAALKAARAGAILLKNQEETLPLPEGPGVRIAVCGPFVSESPTMGGGSCHVARTTGTVDLLDGMKTVSLTGTEIIPVPWNTRGRLKQEDRDVIAAADAVIITCGFNYMDESELYDRSWRLPRAQRRLIAAVSGLNTRCTVVLTAGGGVETKSWIAGVPALVHGLYLGQHVGTATAELLFGRENFQGRLPFSMARNWKDIPASRNYPRRYNTTSPGRMFVGQGHPGYRRMRHWNYAEGLMVGYRHFDTAGVEPAFPFGHGLSYTEFTIDNVELSGAGLAGSEGLEVEIRIRNTGTRSGHQTVQVYVSEPESRLPRPEKELKGFAGIRLDAGESGYLTVSLPPRAFSYWDPEAESDRGTYGAWVTGKGSFIISIGSSSRDIAHRITITAP